MHRSRFSPLPALALAAVVALAACSKPAADDAAPATSAPAGDAAAAPADAGAGATAPQTDTAAAGFVLDMGRANAYFATLAQIAKMSKADAARSGDGEEDDVIAMDASESVDAYIARMEADPEAKRLLTSAGMSVREFAHTNSAMLEGLMAVGMMEATGRKEVPEGINPQYVAFVQAHKAEFEAKMQALQAHAGEQ